MKKFLEGFVSFEVAIYFRLDYNDDIDPKSIERLTEILRKPAPWDE